MPVSPGRTFKWSLVVKLWKLSFPWGRGVLVKFLRGSLKRSFSRRPFKLSIRPRGRGPFKLPVITGPPVIGRGAVKLSVYRRGSIKLQKPVSRWRNGIPIVVGL